MDNIYLLIEGKREGPYTEEAILQAVGMGFVPSYLLAWHEGLADWIPVARLVGLLLALRAAPQKQVEQAFQSVTLTSSQTIDLRANVLSLTVACPYDSSNPRSCPWHEIRKKSLQKKCTWIEELSDAHLLELLAYHQSCLENKMKMKK